MFGHFKELSYICNIILDIMPMRKNNILYRVIDLYYDGFRSMRLGRTLWAIIIIKLFIIFVVLKIFFFPNFLKQHADGDEAGFVATELTQRAANP